MPTKVVAAVEAKRAQAGHALERLKERRAARKAERELARHLASNPSAAADAAVRDGENQFFQAAMRAEGLVRKRDRARVAEAGSSDKSSRASKRAESARLFIALQKEYPLLIEHSAKHIVGVSAVEVASETSALIAAVDEYLKQKSAPEKAHPTTALARLRKALRERGNRGFAPMT